MFVRGSGPGREHLLGLVRAPFFLGGTRVDAQVLRGHSRPFPSGPRPSGGGRRVPAPSFPRVPPRPEEYQGGGEEVLPAGLVHPPAQMNERTVHAQVRGDASGLPPTDLRTARNTGARGTARTTTANRSTAKAPKGQ